MIRIQSIMLYLMRYSSLSGLIYVALILALCLTSFFMAADIVDRYRARNTSLEMLSRLERYNDLSSNGHNGSTASWPPGSPLLEGRSVTVASAALLQRLINIITHAGGTVVSSEMQQQGAQSKDGYVTAIANCELEQEALQRVLYEIESGQPFLFIDQLTIQAPTLPSDGHLRVVLSVAGLWREEK